MKNIKPLCIALILFSAIYNMQAQTLTKLTCQFHTTSNDKDWNTQPGMQVYVNKTLLAAELFCCSSDKPSGSHQGDHWNDNSDSPILTVPLKESVSKITLYQGTFRVSSKANGNDRWDFDVRLHADFSDGSHRDWTFLANSLNSRNSSREIKDFSLQ